MTATMITLKPVEPNAIVRDPITKRPLSADGDEVTSSNFWTRRWLAGEVWRRIGDTWERMLPDGKIERVAVAAAVAAMPTGAEPVAPLNTRGK